MGGLEVVLYEGGTADSQTQSQAIPVYYMSPFWGSTSSEFEGNDSSNFNDVQKSYGMWMIPPDIGSCVMVMFVRGMANAGYWIGCVPDTYQDQMVPGIASSRFVALTPEQERKYGTTNLPVAEFLKRSRDISGSNVDKFTKPVHPFADRLLAQGLLLDDIRGITSSSARREYPSSVFGISTPGPIDTSNGAKTGQVGFDVKKTAFVSRVGGTTFVMDDGDQQGLNELVRIRTRTGHQILLHNSSDLIYIGNAAGTAWMEFTSQGKLDIYCADSVSIHSEGDMNLRADRDFNIESARNVNIAARGEIHLESDTNMNIVARNNLKMQTSQEIHFNAGTDMFIGSGSDVHLVSTDGVWMTSGKDMNIYSEADMHVASAGNLDLASGLDLRFKSNGSFGLAAIKNVSIAANDSINLRGFAHLNLTSPDLQINGREATTGPEPKAPTVGTQPDKVDPLPRFDLPNRYVGEWSDGQFYKASPIATIMTRVPTHEPYDQHESVNPVRFSPQNTDVYNTSTNVFPHAQINFNKVPVDSAAPPVKTGDIVSDNIAAFLWVIRKCEGTAIKGGYSVINGPNPKTGAFPWVVDVTSATLFDGGPPNKAKDYLDHPRYVNTYPSSRGVQKSSACGAYQWMPTTWDGCKRSLQNDPKWDSVHTFSPANQDKAAILLLQQLGAYDFVVRGKLQLAINKCGSTWTSMPASQIVQSAQLRTYAQCAQWFKEGGGTLAE
jgi:muramidase (phage lysozyme)